MEGKLTVLKKKGNLLAEFVIINVHYLIHFLCQTATGNVICWGEKYYQQNKT